MSMSSCVTGFQDHCSRVDLVSSHMPNTPLPEGIPGIDVDLIKLVISDSKVTI